MRFIGTISDGEQAGRFGDFLLAKGIRNTVELAGGGFAVWVEDDDRIPEAQAELERFRQAPDDARYGAARKVAGTIRDQEEKRSRRLRDRFIDVRTRAGRPMQWGRPVTIVMILISIAVAFLTQLGEKIEPVMSRLLMESVKMTPDGDMFWSGPWVDIRHGQVWRLITPIFIHFGALHLIFNMFWLWDLGVMIEMRRGTWRFLALVIASAVLSNLAGYYWYGPFCGGMSGVVYALFGYVWIKSRYQPDSQLQIGQQSVTIMLIWLVVCMMGMMGNVDNAAHLVGLVAGVTAAGTRVLIRKIKRRL